MTKKKRERMETQVYQVMIKIEGQIIFKAFVTGPEDIEIELLDYYYQKYWEQEPDISKYSVRNLTKDFDRVLDFDKDKALQFSAAVNAMEYSDKYS
jgi:hypothetical protein